MKSAIGIVMPIEKTPHGDSASALTTTSARTASSSIMIRKTAISAATPPTTPISSRTIWPSDLPLRRIEKNRITMSWTAPARMTPTMIQIVPGR